MNEKEIIEFVKEKHKNQKYSNNKSYFDEHIVLVLGEMMKFKDRILDKDVIEVARIAVLMHDLLEDTDATKEEIMKLTNKEVYDTVYILTRQRNESYLNYLIRVFNYGGPALLVKFADLNANITASRVEIRSGRLKGDQLAIFKQRLEKYELARHLVVKYINEDLGIDLTDMIDV